jgi:hypothetical protein
MNNIEIKLDSDVAVLKKIINCPEVLTGFSFEQYNIFGINNL